MNAPRPRRTSALVVLALLPLAGCEGDAAPRQAPPGGDVAGRVGRVHINPGGGFVATASLPNPYLHDPAAVQEGERLYGWYNCNGCHGSNGGGGMGPPLRDERWIYGRDAVSIYESIMEGRPNGMPTWQGKIPDDQAWKITAFVQSLGGTSASDPRQVPRAEGEPEAQR